MITGEELRKLMEKLIGLDDAKSCRKILGITDCRHCIKHKLGSAGCNTAALFIANNCDKFAYENGQLYEIVE